MRGAVLLTLLAALASGCRRDASAEGFVEADAVAEADAGPADAAAPDAAPPDAAAPVAASGLVRYPDDREQSPITPAIAENLRAIAARAPQNERVFAKLGDSISDSTAFLDC